MPNPPKNNTPDKALVERLRSAKANYFGSTLRAMDAHAAADEIERLSQPQHGGLVESDQAIEIAAAYYANNQGERSIPFARGIIAALASNSPVVGEDCSHEAWNSNIHGESVCVDCGKYLGIKPTPTDTADRSCTCHPDDRPEGPCPQKFAAGECTDTADTPLESGLVDALRRMADTGEHGEKALDGKSCRRLAREALAALTTAPTAPVDRETIRNAVFYNTGCSEKSAEQCADAIASLLPTSPSVGEGDPA